MAENTISKPRTVDQECTKEKATECIDKLMNQSAKLHFISISLLKDVESVGGSGAIIGLSAMLQEIKEEINTIHSDAEFRLRYIYEKMAGRICPAIL